ncbi:LOW QUALITY PROTEIN: rab GDP dissociation inhibitor beta-like [Vombatus ursinus]|uniref:LOW QUALITY PROTEIN: rab GDP dissociation inhibitor beta-like n=1 Tax=Vombatus ursinus TaxID=29139 RepID=UPI000FFD5AD8|nr:LOW QUALITY PROTEIN: rab GDP dissociation inhibitor beta-like [Vombatus ursinus]
MAVGLVDSVEKGPVTAAELTPEPRALEYSKLGREATCSRAQTRGRTAGGRVAELEQVKGQSSPLYGEVGFKSGVYASRPAPVPTPVILGSDCPFLAWGSREAENPTVEKAEKPLSLAKNGKSPYLYLCCGIGELVQAFGRLTSSQGGVFLMSQPVEEVLIRDGQVVGIRSKDRIARCSKQLICDPSYAPDRVCKVGQVIRAICILGHPIRNTNGANSGLIIIPSTQTNRRSDIYIFLTSFVHNVAAQGKYIALVSTTVESKDPKKEIQLALELLEPIEQKFFFISDLHMPSDLGTKSQIFVMTCYDATVHFESTCDDIKEVYRKMTGSELKFEDLKKRKN